MKSQKKVKVKVIGQRYFVIHKRSPFKMQKTIRQLLETVNFAFIKIFDLLVKIALYMASLLFWEITVMLYGRNRTRDPGGNA